MDQLQVYTGHWHSTKYPSIFAHGKVNVRLKDSKFPSSREPYTTTANLTYLGWYRKNQQVQLQVQVSGDQKFQSSIETHQSHVAQYSQRKASQLASPTVNGDLNFIITQQQGDSIKGTYTLSKPYDKGVFHIKRGFRAPATAADNQQCVVT